MFQHRDPIRPPQDLRNQMGLDCDRIERVRLLRGPWPSAGDNTKRQPSVRLRKLLQLMLQHMGSVYDGGFSASESVSNLATRRTLGLTCSSGDTIMSQSFAPPKVTIRRHLASQICDVVIVVRGQEMVVRCASYSQAVKWARLECKAYRIPEPDWDLLDNEEPDDVPLFLRPDRN